MIKFKYFVEESNKDEYQVIQTTGLSGGQKPVDKPEDDYKPIKTSGLSGGQKPRKPKSQISINPIKEDMGNVKPRPQVTKHQETDHDVLFAADKRDTEGYKFKKDYMEKHNKEYFYDTDAESEYDKKYGIGNNKLMKKIGMHSRGYETFHSDSLDQETRKKHHAIKHYTISSYDVNNYIHEKENGTHTDQDSEPSHLETIKNLDNALKGQKAPHDFYVYTGLKGDINPGNRNGVKSLEKADDHLKVRMPSYTSTSMHPTVALGFAHNEKHGLKDEEGNPMTEHHMLKIKIPKGSEHGMYVGHMSSFPHEHEFLMKRNKKLHVHPEPEIHHYTGLNYAGQKYTKKVHVWHGHMVEDDNA